MPGAGGSSLEPGASSPTRSPVWTGNVCGYDQGFPRSQSSRCWRQSRMRRSPLQNLILSKPLSFLLLPANIRRGNSERFYSKSQGHPLTSLCRPFCASAQGPGQSQRCRRGRELPASSFLSAQGSEVTPSTLAEWRVTPLTLAERRETTESKAGVAQTLPSPILK